MKRLARTFLFAGLLGCGLLVLCMGPLRGCFVRDTNFLLIEGEEARVLFEGSFSDVYDIDTVYCVSGSRGGWGTSAFVFSLSKHRFYRLAEAEEEIAASEFQSCPKDKRLRNLMGPGLSIPTDSSEEFHRRFKTDRSDPAIQFRTIEEGGDGESWIHDGGTGYGMVVFWNG